MTSTSRILPNPATLTPGFLLLPLIFISCLVTAQEAPFLHPTFPLLDRQSGNVLTTGQAVSPRQTCGGCHDTEFIQQHSSHNVPGWFSQPQPGPLKRRIDTAEPAEPAETPDMNCFLCHAPHPNNQARIESLRNGQPEWAGTATLAGSGIMEKSGENWQWNRDAFDQSGNLKKVFSQMQAPGDENCGLCHGLVHQDAKTPLTYPEKNTGLWTTQTSGQIFSPQRLFRSGMNLSGKKELSYAWDVHSERLVRCVDCHYSTNNPVYFLESPSTRPAHLKFDARRMDIKEYLFRPNHILANGSATAHSSTRRCESCHDSRAVHDWLPYKERHLNAISCESCHIPKLHAPAIRQIDWTIPDRSGMARTEFRGVEGSVNSVNNLVSGFKPVLLRQKDYDGYLRLSPFNLITSWYWVEAGTQLPIPLDRLETALFDNSNYYPDILTALDDNKDGRISEAERILNSSARIEAVRKRLQNVGIQDPEIRGVIQAFGIHHNVTNFDWATRNCTSCHSEKSQIYRPMQLAADYPAGMIPEFLENPSIEFSGDLIADQDDGLTFRPLARSGGLFVLGHDTADWANFSGMIIFLLVLAGVMLHGGMRVVASLRQRNHVPEAVEPVYMYHTYERFWHWLQAVAIIILIFSGLIIHSPDTYSLFDYALIVALHNIVGFILLINAFFAAFYHIAGGEIKQYLPEPKGFFSQMIEQTIYYIKGIFADEPHPFEKTERKKLNPLQRITYLMILNILLPLQIFSGLLIWGAQHWPGISGQLGGLGFLIPAHSLLAWLFAAFLVMHIYLTTTGHTPLSNIKAMVTGWDEIPQTANHSQEGK